MHDGTAEPHQVTPPEAVAYHLSYFVKYAYPHRPEPDMFISCTQPM
jgi:hypothetical protein